MSDIIYIKAGRYPMGLPIYNFDGTYVRPGIMTGAEPVFSIRDNKIYQGRNYYGIAIYNIEDNFIYQGTIRCGEPVFRIEDNIIYQGRYGLNAVYNLTKYM